MLSAALMHAIIPFTLLVVIDVFMFAGKVGTSITTVVILLLWSYWVHRLCHLLKIPVLGDIHSTHHEKHRTKYHDFLEFIMDFLVLGGVPLLFLGQGVLSENLIIVYAATYALSHFVLHLSENNTHRHHHKHPHINYGPDVMDHVFGTPGGTPPDNMLYTIPIIAMMSLVLFLI